MKFSICIPTYNGEKYLIECLESCINQSIQDYEIIIVDDGSTDKTIEICKTYLAKSSKIKLHFNEINLGLVGNWNRCIELAEGEWIKFVFQDDYLEPNCLEKFEQYIHAETNLLVSKRSFILAQDMDVSLKRYYNQEVRTFENINASILNNFVAAAEVSRLSTENICLNFIGEPSLGLFRKSVIQEIGNYNSDMTQICDLEFFLRIGSNYGLIYIPEKLCHFRIHASSTTSTNLESKTYILSHLEPIVLVNQLLFNKHYEALRKALSGSQIFKLKTFFKVRCYEAYRESKKSNDTRKSFEIVADKFVEIKKLIHADLSTKLTYLLVKLKRQLGRN